MSKEYIEREALIARYDAEHAGPPGRARDLIATAPAADVVSVIRCKDCVYARPLKDMNYDYLCQYWNGHSCNQNQFCSQGKRKDKTK